MQEWFNSHNSTNVIHHINKMKNKNQIIILIAAEKEFENIILKYPETLEVIPMLLAVRSNEIFVKDSTNEYLFKFNKMVYSIGDYIKFMRETGLFELLQKHIINKENT